MKRLFLSICRLFGLFHLAKQLTASRPRILCYHGISLEDEHLFRPGLFMQPSTFAQRIQLIKKWGYQVISLDELSGMHQSKQYGVHQAAITIDDGWAGIEQFMVAELAKHAMPSTLYLSSYYAEKQVPVFNVAVAYLMWSQGGSIELAGDSYLYQLTHKRQLTTQDITSREAELSFEQRQTILQELAQICCVDIQQWQHAGRFRYLDIAALKRLQENLCKIELHTHRHTFPQDDRTTAELEVERNRQWIHEHLGESTHHFCYPSGEYVPAQFDWLQSLNIATATTTHNEIVSPEDHPLELPRIMDSNAVSSLEFEAELTGFMTLLRKLR